MPETMSAEYFDRFLDIAYVNNNLPRDLPRTDLYLWLSSLGWRRRSHLATLGR
jgi:hypothetical protein